MLEFQSPYEADLVFSGSQLGDLINDTDNPWLTLGIMDSIDDPDLLREWGVLLGMQTRLLGPREVEWLRSNGFGVDGAGILEPGSGDGTYGSFLARNFPEARIYGLEANSSLAGRFRPKEEVPNYSIDICKVGDDPLPQNLSGKFNQCFLRFVLQHTSDPRPLLLAAYNALPSGEAVRHRRRPRLPHCRAGLAAVRPSKRDVGPDVRARWKRRRHGPKATETCHCRRLHRE